MKPAVFLGPSLPLAVARDIIDADFLPPIAQGDLMRLLPERPVIAVILDGRFEDAPPILHNEILYAMQHGVTVIGAASMGALRAAELARYGMVGVGCIYRAYRRGRLEDDDEVAVLHAPHELGAAPLTEAMVNVRATCRLAVRRGVLAAAESAAFVAFAKAIHYKDRTWASMLATRDLPLAAVKFDRFAAWATEHRVDQKAKDAAAALVRARIRSHAPPRDPAGERIEVEPTRAWLRLIDGLDEARG